MNNNLPIVKYAKEIVSAVKENEVVIIKAEAGSGKSTQVPQMLYEAGYEVVITEPRRLATSTLAMRVAEEMEEELGGLVGYKNAFEESVSQDTKILYCTDGLQLIFELTDKNQNLNKVLIIDEVHEWNRNIEGLIAWTKKRINEGWNTKVVIMSATLDDDSLKSFYGSNTKVIDIYGSLFPVSYEESNQDMIKVIEDMIIHHHNTLVFLPGKNEIYQTISKLQKRLNTLGISAKILPLHGELDRYEQKKCFMSYEIPKVVVATNIAQTSITISDIDAVVDSGLERILIADNGIESLVLNNCSKADLIQRKGRAGRCKEGKYILCSNVSFGSRREFCVPEICRTNLDQTVLRFESIGIDVTQVEFFHQPDSDELRRAKKALTELGAFENGKITKIGEQMAYMPISARYARMIIEANRLKVLDDVIIIAAILEVGSIVDFRKMDLGYSRYTAEEESDLIAELNVYKKILSKGKVNFKKESINAKRFSKVKELIEKLKASLEGKFKFGSTGNIKNIKKACITGMANNFFYLDYKGYSKGDEVYWQIDKNSCIFAPPAFVVGLPKVIEFKNHWDIKEYKNILTMVTEVDLTTMLNLAPQLFIVKKGINPYYSQKHKCCCSQTIITYNGYVIERRIVKEPHNKEAKRLEEEFLSSAKT